MSWLIRNRTALIALALLVPLCLLVAFRAGESPPNFIDPSEQIANDASGVGELGGMRFRVTDSAVLSASSPELTSEDIALPQGTQLVLVTVEVVPAPEAVADPDRITSCVASLLGAEGTSNPGVVWDMSAAGRLGLPRGDGVARDSCDLSEPVGSTIEFSFLTPVIPEAELNLQLSNYSTLPDYLLWPLPAR